MQRRPVALVAAVALLALGLFLLWRKLEGGPSAPHDAGPAATGEVEPPAAPGPLEEPSVAEESLARADAVRTVSELAARTETFALAGATWIQGAIRFPEDSPEDDTLEAWAFEDSVARAVSPSENDLPDRVRTGRLEKGWWSRRPIDATGAFRLPIPKGATSAFAVVDGRFLYLAKAAHVDLAAGNVPLALEPELGAWLVGRCRVPSSAGAEDAPVGAPVTFTVSRHSPDGDPEAVTRSTRVGPDLAFELRGAPVDLFPTLWVEPERLVPTFRSDLELVPGRRCEIELALVSGARVSGNVIDEAGLGIAGAIVRLDRRMDSTTFLNAQGEKAWDLKTTTRADGSFALVAIRPGKARIRAQADGFAGTVTDELSLQDGEIRTGLALTLSRGHSVRGTVTWPDGAPAIGTVVHAASKRHGPAGDHDPKRGKTGKQGEFTIAGLGDGPVTLTAVGHRAVAGQEAGGNPPAWTAELADVAAGATGVALVLREPVGLAGRVVDDQGSPVQSFAITASPEEEEGARVDVSLKTTTFESADGSFLLAGLQPGRWRITASAKGCVQVDEPVVDVPRGEGPLLVVLPRAASVSGRVVDPAGAPVAGADVVRASAETFGMFVDPRRTPSAKSDEKGVFTVPGLPPGSLQLQASAEGFARSTSAAVQLDAGQELEDVVVQLRRGGRLTGEVFDSAGGRALGRQVMVMSIGAQEARETTVDAEGTFIVENLAPGAYQVVVEPSKSEREAMAPKDGEALDPGALFAAVKMTSAEIREGETTHVVLGVPPRAPVRVFGTVTRAGEPLRSGTVVCVGEGGGLLSKLKIAQVRQGGDYELKVDEPGPVVLSFQRVQGRSGTSEHHVVIPEKPEFRVDLEVPTGGLRGVVRGPDGAALAGIRVSLLRQTDFSPVSAMDQSGDPSSGEDGRFEYTDLAPGTYGVAAGGSNGIPRESDAVAWGRVVVSGLRVEADKIPPSVEIRLSKAGTITGLVRDADGNAVAGATVFARDERGETLHRFSGVVSDASGRFTYRGISAGRYVMCARTKTLASPESAPVSVHEGGSAEAELSAGPGTTLLVSVEDKEGATLHAGFDVRDEHGHDVSGMYDMGNVEGVLTEGLSSTRSRIGPLPPGEYKVTATAFDGRSASRTVNLHGPEELGLKLRLE